MFEQKFFRTAATSLAGLKRRSSARQTFDRRGFSAFLAQPSRNPHRGPIFHPHQNRAIREHVKVIRSPTGAYTTPCGFEHRVVAAVCVDAAAATDWKNDDHWAKHPLLAATTAAGCGTLPDVLEPALLPRHRQFFYSFLLATGQGRTAHDADIIRRTHKSRPRAR